MNAIVNVQMYFRRETPSGLDAMNSEHVERRALVSMCACMCRQFGRHNINNRADATREWRCVVQCARWLVPFAFTILHFVSADVFHQTNDITTFRVLPQKSLWMCWNWRFLIDDLQSFWVYFEISVLSVRCWLETMRRAISSAHMLVHSKRTATTLKQFGVSICSNEVSEE